MSVLNVFQIVRQKGTPTPAAKARKPAQAHATAAARAGACTLDRNGRAVVPRAVHVVSVSGGKDSLATLLIALERCPAGSVVPIFCDTGNEDQAVYNYLDYLEMAMGITITPLKADFTEELAAKRQFIARDVRTRREYDTQPMFEADGVTPVLKRDGRGNIVLNKKGKRYKRRSRSAAAAACGGRTRPSAALCR